MKILFLTHYAQYYGANRSLVNMIEGFQALGYGLKVIVPTLGEFTEALEAINCSYEVVAFSPFVYRQNRLSFFLKKKKYQKNTAALDAMKAISQAFCPSFIYSNSSVFDMGYRLAQQMQIPHIWHLREMAELHYHYKFYPNRAYFETALKNSNLLIAISRAIVENVLKNKAINNYKIVYNAVFSKQQFADLPLGFRQNNQPLVLTVVGMLHPSKQQAEVIKAFAKIHKDCPKAALWIVGSGQPIYTFYLQRLIAYYGLKNKVKLWGYLPNMDKIYQQTDIVIVASKYEGLGRSTIEGMAYQKPIIGFDSGATPELIADGKRGLLYGNNSSNNLAKAMIKLLKNPKQREEMGRAGRAFVSKHFMIEDYVKQLDIILKETLSQH